MATLALLSSSLTPVLLVSRQITSCLADFTSCCVAAAADACFVTSPAERDGNDAADQKREKKLEQQRAEDWDGLKDRKEERAV